VNLGMRTQIRDGVLNASAMLAKALLPPGKSRPTGYRADLLSTAPSEALQRTSQETIELATTLTKLAAGLGKGGSKSSVLGGSFLKRILTGY